MLADNLSAVTLVLFMTEGMSLRAWERLGLFEREVALYLSLRPHLRGISIVTYGSRTEEDYSARLPGIDILCNRWNLPLPLYSRLLPWLHATALRDGDIYKTNQMRGAVWALRAARIWRKPLIARCGYLWSDFVAGGADTKHRLGTVRAIERRVFSLSSRVVVTTSAMKETITAQYGVATERITVQPNYVLTEVFSPGSTKQTTGGVCFVGRLEYQKNTMELLKAFRGLDVPLVVIGDGSMRVGMESYCKENNLQVTFLGNVAHYDLVAHLRRASIFILPSLLEGHPKTLIEAMSCGVAVIGADSPGIRELIRHGDTGWLCGVDAESIRLALRTLMSDERLRKRLGANARRYAVEMFSLEKATERECELITETFCQQCRS